MSKSTDVEFKSLLTEAEYNKLMEKFKGSKTDFQTNHYFDTKRFSLKALDASLRVRERENFELTLKKKKGYNLEQKTVSISEEQFELLKQSGVVPFPELMEDLAPLIKDQKLINFLSLSTYRMFLPYSNGILNIDKSEYLGVIDYEIEYTSKSFHQGKVDFVKLINEFGIQYKKSDKKIKRAFNALKSL